jgi:uncharacterized coiled-coil DUF342 family protein
MSAYLTAMMEAPKEDVIAELMRAKDELASLKSENERLKESNARYRNDVDVMLEQLDEMNKLNDTITAERDSLRRVVEKLREIPSSTPREIIGSSRSRHRAVVSQRAAVSSCGQQRINHWPRLET